MIKTARHLTLLGALLSAGLQTQGQAQGAPRLETQGQGAAQVQPGASVDTQVPGAPTQATQDAATPVTPTPQDEGIWERLPSGEYRLMLLSQPPRAGGTPRTVRYPGGELRVVWRVDSAGANLAQSRAGLLYNAETDPALRDAATRDPARPGPQTVFSASAGSAANPSASVTPPITAPVTGTGTAPVTGTGPATPSISGPVTAPVTAAVGGPTTAQTTPSAGGANAGGTPDPAFRVKLNLPAVKDTAATATTTARPTSVGKDTAATASATPRPAPTPPVPTITPVTVEAGVANAGLQAATRTVTPSASAPVKATPSPVVKATPVPAPVSAAPITVPATSPATAAPNAASPVRAEATPGTAGAGTAGTGTAATLSALGVSGAARCAALEVSGTLLERRWYPEAERAALLAWWTTLGGRAPGPRGESLRRGGELITLLDAGAGGLCVQRSR